MRKILAIKVNTNPTRYVSDTSNRPDGKIALTLTDKKDEAHDFVTAQNANRIIDNAVNPWNRVFTLEKMEVNQPKAFEFDGRFN